MEFRLLGPVEVSTGNRVLGIGPPQQRLVVAALAVDAGRLVTVESLIDRVWDDAPHGARRTLHVLISRVRQALREDGTTGAAGEALVRRPGGYVLRIDPDQVDVYRFRHLAGIARRRGEACQPQRLREALTWWRGEPLSGLAGGWAARMRAAWWQEYLGVVVAWAQAELHNGDPAAAIGPLTALAAEYPFAESLSAALMQALSAVGRPADALALYGRVRQRLADELGADPGRELQDVYQAILRGDAVGAGERSTVTRQLVPDRAPAPDSPDSQLPTRTVPVAAGKRLVPRQLPTAPRLFTGRTAELASLSAALAGPGEPPHPTAISVISGTAGVGKTWLALRWAHEHADRFPDGQIWVSLRGFDPSEPPLDTEAALRALLEVLGVPPADVPAEPQAQSGLYRSLVSGKRLLLVLDDARDTSQVLPLLPGGPGCTVLVTSRRRLAGLATGYGALILTLDVLNESEARDLLAHHIGPERLAAEPGAAASLLACCAGLPLAISIAAAHAVTHPGFPLAMLAADLADDATRLDGLETGDSSASVRSVLSCSYHVLGAQTAALFELLGLVPGRDVSLAAAASVCGLAIPRAKALLHELENAHLVQQYVPGRYRMHDLVALYARERAERNQPAEVRAAALLRLVDYYLHTAAAGERLLSKQRDSIRLDQPAAGSSQVVLPDRAAALAWFRTEYTCLLAAQRLAMARGWYTQVWQLAWAANTFHKFQANLRNWVSTWRAGLVAADHLAHPAIQVLARRWLSQACAYTGRQDEALGYLNEAMRLAETAGDLASQAHIESARARTCERQGNYRKALTHAVTALAFFREAGLPVWEADELGAVGWFHAHLGHLGEARAACHAALSLHIRHQDRHGEANATDTLGFVAVRAGHYSAALDYYARALALWRELGHSHGEADSLAGLALAYAACGAFGEASDARRSALELFGDQHRVTEADRFQRQLESLLRRSACPWCSQDQAPGRCCDRRIRTS